MAADSGTAGSDGVDGGALAGMLAGYATDQYQTS